MAYYTESLERPLARRRLMTFRPSCEAILILKPWVRTLFLFFGW